MIATFHRPHPAKEAKRYQVRGARRYLVSIGNRPMNVMSYKGQTARVHFDEEDRLFVGHLTGINDIVGFHAETVADLVAAFHEAVDDYLETCARVGKRAESPYSGKLMLRVRPEVHARAALAAQLSGKSMNQWSEEVLASAASASIPSG